MQSSSTFSWSGHGDQRGEAPCARKAPQKPHRILPMPAGQSPNAPLAGAGAVLFPLFYRMDPQRQRIGRPFCRKFLLGVAKLLNEEFSRRWT